MNFFCSKDCPDLCGAEVSLAGRGLLGKGVAEPWSTPGFLCSKFKIFAAREIANGQMSWRREGDQRRRFDDPAEALAALADYLQAYRDKKILYLRGSGSLAYNMACWDQLFSGFADCWSISGGPCDDTGSDAHLADFGALTNPDVANLEQADSIILYGKNAAATSPHFYAFLKKLKKQGKRLIYIDPVGTRTAELADRFILINPGCDGLLACALLCELGLESGYNVAELLDLAGVNREEFNDLLNCIRNGRTAHVQGIGLQRQRNGMNAFRWINRLAVRTGQEDLLYYSHSSRRQWLKPVKRFAGQVHVDSIAQKLADGEFDLFVNVASNPAMTFPDSNLWRAGLNRTPSLVIDTNQCETAEAADFFLKVGGMFAQEDFMGSNFFPHDYSRGRITEELNDLSAARQLAEKLDIPMDIGGRDQPPRVKQPTRRYREVELDLVFPEAPNSFQLITSSHQSYLNSQILPGMEKDLQVIHIATADAERLGITAGDDLRVSGPCGSFVGTALLTNRIAPQTLMCWKNIPMKEGQTNDAIPNELTDAGSGLAYYAAMVELERV